MLVQTQLNYDTARHARVAATFLEHLGHMRDLFPESVEFIDRMAHQCSHSVFEEIRRLASWEL